MQRKSNQQKRNSGTFRPDREKKVDPTGLLQELPMPPWELSDAALRIYIDEGNELILQGILKPSDIRLLAMYCTEVATYIELMAAAQSEGIVIELPNGISTSNAHRKAAESALKNSSALADKLGISPIGRARLGIKSDSVPSGKPDPLDPFSDFLRPMSN
jgi:P27 family predicted phage terminase small subunit